MHVPSSLAAAALAALLGSTLAAQEGQSTAGAARARELAELGLLPSIRDVAVRDIVNYHRHRLPLPKVDQDVALDVRFDRSAAAPGDTVVLQVGYTTRPEGDRTQAPPCSLVLVVDRSGSMQDRGKMDQVRAGLRDLAQRLRADDEVALVSFSTEARLESPLRRRGDGEWLLAAIDRLAPDGSTNLHAGLMLGLEQFARGGERDGDSGRAPRDRSRRLVLLTDGIANLGVTDPSRILDEAQRAMRGVDVSTIGFGRDVDTTLLERLAAGTRGLFHFVADERDINKVFVQELDALLVPAARKPRMHITLSPGLAAVHAYGEETFVRPGEVVVDLRDLNAGVTGVVLVTCRVDDPARARADAELTFTSAASMRSERAAAAASLSDNHGSRQVDLEVQKNHAIAILAQGLRDMASACDERRWANADRALRLAGDEAERVFPGADADVQRVRDVVAGHSRTLRRYVDRFRED